MTSPLDNGNRWAVVGVAAFALGCLGLAAEHTPALALINESPSLPTGVYLRRPGVTPDRNAIVTVPQPEAARAYLGPLGMPGDLLLIKRVAAVGGDRVCRRGDRVEVPGRTVVTLSRDGRGALLPLWSGCRVLDPDMVFLLGDTPSSFDSRYFGPVRRAQIDGVYEELLTW